jgi:hypothetical protein
MDLNKVYDAATKWRSFLEILELTKQGNESIP